MTVIREKMNEIHPKKEIFHNFGEYLDTSRFSLPAECFIIDEKDIAW